MSLLGAFRPRAEVTEWGRDGWSDGGWGASNAQIQSRLRTDPDLAMQLVAVYACVTLIADAIRALPVDTFAEDGEDRERTARPVWVDRPNEYQTWGSFLDFLLHCLLVAGNGFPFVTGLDRLGFPKRLEAVHPDEVTVDWKDKRKEIRVNGELVPEYSRTQPTGVLHILGHSADGLVGLSPIAMARQAVAQGLSIEAFGNQFFENAAVPSGVLEMPVGSVPTQAQLDQTAAQFSRRHSGLKNAGRPIVLANGTVWKSLSVPNDQAQFVESAGLSVSQIARLYRVPPHLIGDVERSTSWGTGIEQQGIGFVTYTLMPWMTRLEDAFSQLLPVGQSFKFNANALLRGDTKARFEAYQIGIQNGYITRNEVRALEDLPPLDGGDTPLMPLNLTAADATAGMASTRELTEMIQKIYLGVGKVLTSDEAREILNREGAGLAAGFEPFPLPGPSNPNEQDAA